MKQSNACKKRFRSFRDLILLFGAVAAAVPVFFAHSAADSDLQNKLNSRSQELLQINRQIEETRKTLQSTQSRRQSLQTELHSLDKNLSYLSLTMKSDELHIQKLGGEIGNLQSSLVDISNSISAKRDAVRKILQLVQKRQPESKIVNILLRSASISDIAETAHAYSEMERQMTGDIETLRSLESDYEGKLNELSGKKNQVAAHRDNIAAAKTIMQDVKTEREQILKETKNKESIYQKQISDLQKKQQQIASEIEELDRIARGKIDSNSLPAARPGLLGLPIDMSVSHLTQEYGATDFAKYGYKGKWHNGIDFAGVIGEQIFAAEDGVVLASGNQDLYCYRGAYGRFIVVSHSNGLITLYAHLSRQAVATGAIVKKGDLIGYVGKTGYATGPHLHFTVFAKSTFSMSGSKSCGPMPHGGDLNPLNYLAI